MDFNYSPRVQAMLRDLGDFFDAHIYPNEARYRAEADRARAAGNPWTPNPVIEELKPLARERARADSSMAIRSCASRSSWLWPMLRI